MKRRIFKLCLFLLVGAMINVAVAWACAKWSNRQFHGPAEVAEMSSRKS
jgi:sensor histidine kinase regulating citrate/malate metabolism